MIIFDAHLDLAWNALDWNRDLLYKCASAALFDDLVGNFFVLFGNARLSVKNENGNVATGNRVFSAFDAEKFDRVRDLTRFAHASSVDKNVGLPQSVGFDLERHVHCIASRAWNRADHNAFGTSEWSAKIGRAHV